MPTQKEKEQQEREAQIREDRRQHAQREDEHGARVQGANAEPPSGTNAARTEGKPARETGLRPRETLAARDARIEQERSDLEERQRRDEEERERERHEEKPPAIGQYPTATRSTARPGATVIQNTPDVGQFALGQRQAEEREKARQTRGIRVQATQVGYYDNLRRRIGDVFLLAEDEEFSAKWMQRVSDGAALRTTKPNEAIANQHDEVIAMRYAAPSMGPMQEVAGDNNDPIGDRSDE